MKTIVLSGGFDPLHIGHLEMFKAAKRQGYETHVIVNSDEWLIRKKGFCFQSIQDRLAIIRSIGYVDFVYRTFDSDDTVLASLKTLRPDAFGNGGDRNETTTPEQAWCEANGVELVYGLGGRHKANSSSTINSMGVVERPWGWWQVIKEAPRRKVKILSVTPGHFLSMQRHKHREEYWQVIQGTGSVNIDGEVSRLKAGAQLSIFPLEWHQLRADMGVPLVILEVQIGDILEEDDIERSTQCILT